MLNGIRLSVALLVMAIAGWPAWADVAPSDLPLALPAGYLSASGNQIVDARGNNVRLACLGYDQPTRNHGSDMLVSRSLGFNCVRASYYDKTLDFGFLDSIVAAASAHGMKVILNHHGNEATRKCLGQQENGLWYDRNAGDYNATNDTDGCGAVGTITYAKFKANWVAIAARYANNPTVIGFDLHNEPASYGNPDCCHGPKVNWGDGRGSDMRAMCSDVGAAINVVNSGALIICEAVANANFINPAQFDGTVNGMKTWADLSTAGTNPVTGVPRNKIVYSVHSYPSIPSGGITPAGYGPTWFRSQTKAWGYLVTKNIAPVWLGEVGCSCDGTAANPKDDLDWANAMVSYANGQQTEYGGPAFTGDQQPIGTDWWIFGHLPGQYPNGVLNVDNTPRPGQRRFWSQLLFRKPPRHYGASAK